MAGEEQQNNVNPLLEMDAQRQNSVRPGFPFGQSPNPGGQIDSYDVADIREEFQAKEFEAERKEIEERKNRIIRVQRQLEIGDLVAPTSNSFGGYKAIHDYGLVEESGTFPVQFNAFQFGIFDGKIAEGMEGEEFPNGPMSNLAHEDYPKYTNLRRNIAILRNMLYVECFGRDGYQSFIPSDARNRAKLERMAEMLGDALAKGKNGKAPFFNSLSIDDASVPDQGVVTMYNYLLEIEKQPWHRPIIDALKSPFTTDKSYEWNLKPIEQTPLAPAYMKLDEAGIETYTNFTPKTRGEAIANLGVQLDYARAQLEVPQMLSKPVRDKAINLAMIILENFRLRAGNNPENSNLAMNPQDEFQQIQRIYDISLVYKDKFSQIALQNPAIMNDPTFLNANDAIAKLTYLVKMQALEELTSEKNEKSSQVMAELMDRVPLDHRPQPGETFDVLVSRLEKGLMEAARLRGLPGPWMGMSQQAAQAAVSGAENEKRISNQRGHEDVSTALQEAQNKKMNARIDEVDKEYAAYFGGGKNPISEAGSSISAGTIAGTNNQTANKIAHKLEEAKARQQLQQEAVVMQPAGLRK